MYWAIHEIDSLLTSAQTGKKSRQTVADFFMAGGLDRLLPTNRETAADLKQEVAEATEKEEEQFSTIDLIINDHLPGDSCGRWTFYPSFLGSVFSVYSC
jgi:hypothetical protein